MEFVYNCGIICLCVGLIINKGRWFTLSHYLFILYKHEFDLRKKETNYLSSWLLPIIFMFQLEVLSLVFSISSLESAFGFSPISMLRKQPLENWFGFGPRKMKANVQSGLQGLLTPLVLCWSYCCSGTMHPMRLLELGTAYTQKKDKSVLGFVKLWLKVQWILYF